LSHFYKTWDTNAHYNFGIRKFNIIHCKLRNDASNLKAHLFNDFLSDNTKCPNCSGAKTIIKRSCGGWNVLFSFLKLYSDYLGRYG
jgi:hypothetical protein